ncbi:MAG: hypothetical protein IPK83_04900 [Planctomycetes bacterium]|nr:hypothetical protein [Planctomycetota bacterium]
MIRKSAIRVCFSVVMAALSDVSFATPIEIDVDTSQSSVSVQFCLGANCSTDSSPVTGLTALKLDSIAAPTMLELHDFFYALTETINIALTGLTATGTNITIDYATPGLPQPPDVLGGGGAFVLIDVPANQSGAVNYTATGTTCFLLVLAGYPCVDAISLADQGTQLGDYSGTVVAQPGRIVQFQIQPNISGPLDPANPAARHAHDHRQHRRTGDGTIACRRRLEWRDRRPRYRAVRRRFGESGRSKLAASIRRRYGRRRRIRYSGCSAVRRLPP